MREILLYFSIKYEGDWDKIYKAIRLKESVNRLDIDNAISFNKEKYITILDDNYPNDLKIVNKPPFVIFYRGDINLIYNNNLKIAVIGSRNNSEYGKDMCNKIVEGLVKENTTIISGFARGIDSIAHKKTIDEKGKTIAILGCGIDVIYPKSNIYLYDEILQNGGLFLSEYPIGVLSTRDKFPFRNRLIAGFCNGVSVIEAKNKSGTMITVSSALNIGKDIFCIPYLASCDSGCNSLIKSGAKLIECAKDILEDYVMFK